MKGKYCLVCTPRSGSFYILKHLGETMGLDNGKEWFGRMKKVHYEGFKTSPITVDYTIEEKLLTNSERQKRLEYLQEKDSFIIKCMPMQLTYTVEDANIGYIEKLEKSAEILSNFNLIWLHNRDKISQFCFRFIAQETSRKGYTGTNREFSEYNKGKRKVPSENSFTATEAEFYRFMHIEEFTKDLERMIPNKTDIIYEDYVKEHSLDIITNPDYSKVFTNYQEITEWFKRRNKT